MEKKHINERGTHTTVIEQAGDFINLFSKFIFDGKKAQLSPGKIEGGGRIQVKISEVQAYK